MDSLPIANLEWNCFENEKKERPYGFWESPITAELITKGTKGFGDAHLEGDTPYWVEMRPEEKGRCALVKQNPDSSIEEVIPSQYSVRTRVHEYGGAPFAIKDGIVYFINDKDQCLYAVEEGIVRQVTKPGIRFADLHPCASGLVAVAEKHLDKQAEPENCLAHIDTNTGEVSTIAQGCDFYAYPTLSHDETKIAFICWNHPNMPWDGTELYSADFIQGRIEHATKIAGGEKTSIFQPRWSSDGKLYYISDESGWWNLYCFDGSNYLNLLEMEAEFGTPLWNLGMSTWDFCGNKIFCTCRSKGNSSAFLIDPASLEAQAIPLEASNLSHVHANENFALINLGTATEGARVARLDLKNYALTIVAENPSLGVDKEYISIAIPISFPSKHGRIAHGFYYAPKNKTFKGPKGEAPPLIVMNHGGPTSNTTATFNAKIQFWTSRGFAVLDVDYGGSTGYGRTYRDLLNGNWGVVDVEDCEAGALYLVKEGLADEGKLAIRGGSAGGYTTLASLACNKTFKAGASYYGICDLEVLLKETHKFESRYTISLIGPYPEKIEIYKARSPINHLDGFSCPVIFFQGEEDQVVPPNQAKMMHEALKNKGIETVLVLYPEEQHGFRKAENIQDSLLKELSFYQKVLK